MLGHGSFKETHMPKAIKIKNCGKIKTEIHRYFSGSQDARFIGRLQIALLACRGIPIATIATLFRIAPTTVHRWIHRLNDQGIDGLKDMPGRGRKSSLTKQERQILSEDLKKSPQASGYRRHKWTGRLLSHHLGKRFGIALKERQCQNLLKSILDQKPG